MDNHTAKAILRGGSSYHPIPYRYNPLDPTHLKHTPGNWYSINYYVTLTVDMHVPVSTESESVQSELFGAANLIIRRSLVDRYFPNPMACLQTQTLAGGSLWWRNCPQNVGPLVQHNVFLLLSDSMDRSAGIGFRCAMDGAPTNCTTPWISPGGPCPTATQS